jgi:hypothetical protein
MTEESKDAGEAKEVQKSGVELIKEDPVPSASRLPSPQKPATEGFTLLAFYCIQPGGRDYTVSSFLRLRTWVRRSRLKGRVSVVCS